MIKVLGFWGGGGRFWRSNRPREPEDDDPDAAPWSYPVCEDSVEGDEDDDDVSKKKKVKPSNQT